MAPHLFAVVSVFSFNKHMQSLLPTQQSKQKLKKENVNSKQFVFLELIPNKQISIKLVGEYNHG